MLIHPSLPDYYPFPFAEPQPNGTTQSAFCPIQNRSIEVSPHCTNPPPPAGPPTQISSQKAVVSQKNCPYQQQTPPQNHWLRTEDTHAQALRTWSSSPKGVSSRLFGFPFEIDQGGRDGAERGREEGHGPTRNSNSSERAGSLHGHPSLERGEGESFLRAWCKERDCSFQASSQKKESEDQLDTTSVQKHNQTNKELPSQTTGVGPPSPGRRRPPPPSFLAMRSLGLLSVSDSTEDFSSEGEVNRENQLHRSDLDVSLASFSESFSTDVSWGALGSLFGKGRGQGERGKGALAEEMAEPGTETVQQCVKSVPSPTFAFSALPFAPSIDSSQMFGGNGGEIVGVAALPEEARRAWKENSF
uniref:Uncharacterized protein n=1 Tax=Chromera velia CCMP2878 TaxID=1169474 RepID=A0A0K6S6X7_9ALVE|eukprot:Cvel_3650.t1-p1 / transcript=Cvel_3650.t1 / gene=Cvel_3650 / organism=Chromera_velia_CCMP2878 / gene_product=hypothetical protein / transcript_product=hypothetical protein / location=Cvel_scaffold151:25322-26395(-) / protein_length=358 / sequence_SO=supercontig / SO=protein_coding / is_pseudo=false